MRSALGIVIGAIVWMAVFTVLAVATAAIWPDYWVHGRAWNTEHVYGFTPPMSVVNALLWILGEIAAGWVAVVIARRRQALWVLAAGIGLYLAFMHLYYEWANLPWWYNLLVAIPAVPAVLLGGKLAGRRDASTRAAPMLT
jgi:hypothetical protein